MGNHSRKDRQFVGVTAIPVVKNLSAAAESKLLRLAKRAKGPKLHIYYCREEGYPSRSKQIICMVTLSANHATDTFLPIMLSSFAIQRT